MAQVPGADFNVQKLRHPVLEKGRPYDTMEEVIGLRGMPGHGSLCEWGVAYDELPLAADGGIDWDNLPHALSPGEICTQELSPKICCQKNDSCSSEPLRQAGKALNGRACG